MVQGSCSLMDLLTLWSINKAEPRLWTGGTIDCRFSRYQKSNNFGEYQNHPDDQNDIEDHSNMKKHIEELAVGKFISLLWFTHDSVHHQGG